MGIRNTVLNKLKKKIYSEYRIPNTIPKSAYNIWVPIIISDMEAAIIIQFIHNTHHYDGVL